MGALAVTLPAKDLGSRWAAAYYTSMNVGHPSPSTRTLTPPLPRTH